MIKNIIDLLSASDWYLYDEDIDIAKDKYKSPITQKEKQESKKQQQRQKPK